MIFVSDRIDKIQGDAVRKTSLHDVSFSEVKCCESLLVCSTLSLVKLITALQ